MKTNPPQIGDVYKYDGEHVCVEETYADGAMVYGITCKLRVVSYNWLYPITLTEDWLYKLGFAERDSEWIRMFCYLGGMCTFKVLKNGYTWKLEAYNDYGSPNIYSIIYVHNLQRLLRIYGDFREHGKDLLYGRD